MTRIVARQRLLRLIAIACAIGYPLALAAIILTFRFVGERWWVALTALYLPRAGFALPLPAVLALLYLAGAPRVYTGLQAASITLVLGPLMGLNPGLGRLLPRPGGPSIRVMSFNIDHGRAGLADVLAQVRAFAADVVLLQDAGGTMAPRLRQAFDGWHTSAEGEFFLATRFSIRGAYVPPDLRFGERSGGAHYVQHLLDTPIGLIDVFNVHPASPRPGLEEVQGNGLRDGILSGRLFEGRAGGPAEWNAYRRRRQVAGIAERADASTNAVVIAGDTNLPGLSWILGEHLGRYRDGFRQAGAGFGYTFPARRPWMRLDRILTNDRLRAVEFRTGPGTRSDHRSVLAALSASP